MIFFLNIELQQHKFSICTWKIDCTIYGLVIFKIIEVIF